MPSTTTKATATARAPARLRPAPAAKPQPLTLSVVDITGNPRCITPKDAKKVFDHIHRAFKKQQPVEVSFRGATMITPSFMYPAIGSLYKKYAEKEIRPLVKFTDLDDYGEDLVERAVESGTEYFADPAGYTARMKQLAKELRDEGYI